MEVTEVAPQVTPLIPTLPPVLGAPSAVSGVPLGEPQTPKKRKVTEVADLGSRDVVVGRSIPDQIWKFAEIGMRFLSVATAEKEKKKITVSAFNELLEVKGAYEGVFHAMVEETLVLRGRLAEAREALVTRSDQISSPRAKRSKKEESEAEDVEMREVEKEAVEVRGEVEGKKKKRKKNKKKKKERTEVPKTEQEQKKTYATMVRAGSGTAQGKTEKGEGTGKTGTTKVQERKEEVFQTVTRKKRSDEAMRLERLKERKPDKSFVVSVGEGGAEAAKKALWAEMVRKGVAPQMRGTFVLPRGDLVVKPSDGKTYDALREMERGGAISVREEGQRRPKVLIYDVDRSLETESIPGLIADQNPALKLSAEEAKGAIKPLFRRGPKTGPSVWWVCEVDPKVFRSLAGHRVFIGMDLCRVVEFSSVVQCLACQGFGHLAAKCKRGKVVCGHCSKEGHKDQDCADKGKAPKCANCGLGFRSGHRGCATRRKVYRTVALRTDFGTVAQ